MLCLKFPVQAMLYSALSHDTRNDCYADTPTQCFMSAQVRKVAHWKWTIHTNCTDTLEVVSCCGTLSNVYTICVCSQ